MGNVSSPPEFYVLFEAAQALNCSVMELMRDPERDDLIIGAMAYKRGSSDGEYLLRCNPEFKRMAKERHKATEIK